MSADASPEPPEREREHDTPHHYDPEPSAWSSLGRELTLTQFLGIIIPILCGIVMWGNKIEGEIAQVKAKQESGAEKQVVIESTLKEHSSALREVQLGQVRVEARQSDQNELLHEIKSDIENIRNHAGK